MADKQWQLLDQREIKQNWPLHLYIFEDKCEELKKALKENKVDLEKKDPCGRTALHLAVSLGKSEFVKALLHHKANANAVNKQGWNVCQEAVSCGDSEILSMVFHQRDFQRATQRLDGIPELLDDLKAASDFYIEMKWEFTTWVPFMSRMCPNDTYRIYKQGCNVRIDTTLVGFDQNLVNWERGDMSFIFRGTEGGAEFLEIDHERKQFTKEILRMRSDTCRDPRSFETSLDAINTRMSSPNISTVLDTDSIAFTKHKTMWGWGGDKIESVEEYEGKMYDATGIDVVTRIRFEHLTEEEKEKAKASGSGGGIQSMLTGEQQEIEMNSEDPDVIDSCSLNPYNLSLQDYFNIPMTKSKKDVGKLKDMISKTQKFKATLCLCPSYPLSLQQQVLPVIKLLAISNSHFAKLRDFIALHLPTGFPIKIEIPLFHFLNARITFGNIDGTITPVEGVHCQHSPAPTEVKNTDNLQEESEDLHRSSCSIDLEYFEAPSGYVDQNIRPEHIGSLNQGEEEWLIQLAIQQSLVESTNGDVRVMSWDNTESLPQREDHLQRAIRESLMTSRDQGAEVSGERTPSSNDTASYREQLEIALAMSEQDMVDKTHEDKSEEEELERILKLSLMEK